MISRLGQGQWEQLCALTEKLDHVPEGFLGNGLKEVRGKEKSWISVNSFPLVEGKIKAPTQASGGTEASSLYMNFSIEICQCHPTFAILSDKGCYSNKYMLVSC